jgi:pyruvate/2-oxoglutarate dehydrogenase complex dihydrolipoamide acyltransferase (E2) component
VDTPTGPRQGKIYAAMAAIQKEVGSVAKGRKNQQQGYQYRGIDDIYAALQGLMAEKGVFSLPEVIDQKREERPTRNKDGVLIYTVLTVRHTFYAEDGSCVCAVTVGEGMDSSDKSSNKAMSAAEKYSLIQAFKLPTADVRDSEHDNPRPAARQPAANPPPRANGNGHAPAKDFEMLARKRLADRGFKPAEVEEAVKGIAESWDVTTLDQLDQDQRGRVLRGISTGQADRWKLAPVTS